MPTYVNIPLVDRQIREPDVLLADGQHEKPELPVVADISQEAQHPTRLEDRQLVGQTTRRKPDIPPLDGQMSSNKLDTALAVDNFKGNLTQNILAFFIIFNIKSVFF